VDALKLTLKLNTSVADAAKTKPTSTKPKWSSRLMQRKRLGGKALPVPVAPLEAQPDNINTNEEVATTTPKTDSIENRLADLKIKLIELHLWGGDSDEAVWKSDWELIKPIGFDLNYLVNDVVKRTNIINEWETRNNHNQFIDKQKLLIAANDFIMSTFRRNTVDRSLCSLLYVNWYIVLKEFSCYLSETKRPNYISNDVHGNIWNEWGYQSAEDVFKTWFEGYLGPANPFSQMGPLSPLATQKL
jgi:hypothetical protein